MKTSDEMKKDYDDTDPNLQYQAGYESAIQKYLPKVEMLEKAIEILANLDCKSTNNCVICSAHNQGHCPIIKAKELL